MDDESNATDWIIAAVNNLRATFNALSMKTEEMDGGFKSMRGCIGGAEGCP
jgi:hypothetical protein